MISWLKGNVQYIGPSFIILNVNNIGYELNVAERYLTGMSIGDIKEFFIHQSIREDAHVLFGFINDEELFVFRELIGISGVGPKTALSVLNQCSVAQIIQAVKFEDENVFSSVSGIGAKSARRIILEMKSKISKFESSLDFAAHEETSSNTDHEVSQALQSLGYSQMKVRDVLNLVSKDLDVTLRVKEALKILSSN